jgi:hypothetical protein
MALETIKVKMGKKSEFKTMERERERDMKYLIGHSKEQRNL